MVSGNADPVAIVAHIQNKVAVVIGSLTVGAVHAQPGRVERKTDTAFANIAPLIESLVEQIKTRPDTDLVAEARKWAARYKDLLRRSSITRSSDPLELQIDALERVDLDDASQLLTKLLAEKQGTTKVFAARCYEAGEIELLRFMPQIALPYLEKAYALQPEGTDVATAFSDTLQEQRELERAQPIYHTLLLHYQTLAQQKPAAYQPQIARTLNNLGNLYSAMQHSRKQSVPIRKR